MNESDTLRQRFPLSPRKFWKKLLQGLGLRLVLNTMFLVALVAIAIRAYTIVQMTAATPTAVPASLSLLVFAVPLGIVAAFIARVWYIRAYIRTYFYDASDGFITIRKGVVTPAEIHVQWAKVQDVYVDQDLLDRLLGIYDVHLASATFTSGVEAHIDGVSKDTADGLKAFLLAQIQGAAHAFPVQPLAIPLPVPEPAAPARASEPAAADFATAGRVSSAEYPISAAWLVGSYISLVLWPIILGAFSYFMFWLGTNTPSFLDGSAATCVVAGWACIILAVLVEIATLFNFAWRKTFWFELDDEYILRREGVITRSESHMPYRTVQDVVISQGLLDRLLGIAAVTIQNAAGGGISQSIIIPGQPNEKARDLSARIRDIARRKNAAQIGV